MSADSKILFRVERDDGSADVETLWATSLGEDRYRLDNSPFYAYSVSWEDIVYAPFNSDEEWPTFVHVVEKSGNRTLRVIFDPPVKDGNESDAALRKLLELGCSYEGTSPSFASINVPKETHLADVVDEIVESGVQWEHADPSYDELYPGCCSG